MRAAQAGAGPGGATGVCAGGACDMGVARGCPPNFSFKLADVRLTRAAQINAGHGGDTGVCADGAADAAWGRGKQRRQLTAADVPPVAMW